MPGQEVVARRPYEIALMEIKGRSSAEESNTFEIAVNVADKIMGADSVEGVMDAAGAGPEDLADMEGKPFRFTGYSLRFAESSEQFRGGGTGFYAIFECEDLNRETHTISTGAVNVVFQLKKLEELGVFSVEGQYDRAFTVRSKPTKNGTLYRIDFA
jgi:hypothetical protein